jgi:hypothetical protein
LLTETFKRDISEVPTAVPAADPILGKSIKSAAA